jgi:hypothetical protein
LIEAQLKPACVAPLWLAAIWFNKARRFASAITKKPITAISSADAFGNSFIQAAKMAFSFGAFACFSCSTSDASRSWWRRGKNIRIRWCRVARTAVGSILHLLSFCGFGRFPAAHGQYFDQFALSTGWGYAATDTNTRQSTDIRWSGPALRAIR